MLGRLILCVAHACIVYEVWTYWHEIRDKWRPFINTFCRQWPRFKKRQPTAPLYKSHLLKLKVSYEKKMLMLARHFSFVFLIMSVVSMESRTSTHWRPAMVSHSAVMLASHFVLWHLSTHPISRTRIDIAFSCTFFLSTCIHVPLCYHDYQQQPMEQSIVIVAHPGLRLLFSVVWMNWRFSAALNGLQVVVVWWNARGISPMTGSVFFQLLMVEVCCICLETLFEELLHNELAAHSAKHEMETLLGGLCDAVVRLDQDLCITKATPQLMHLMCPTSPLQPVSLEGSLLSSHLASELDREKFDSFIGNTSVFLAHGRSDSTGHAPALHVSLHHTLGREVPIELFHVCSVDATLQLQHLIGLREVREDGASPDEALFQGRKTAFVHSTRKVELPAKGGQDSVATPIKLLGAARRALGTRSNISSSRSSRSNPLEIGKGVLDGLKKIQMKLDILDAEMGIEEYRLCLVDEKQGGTSSKGLPSLRSCLMCEDNDPFFKWLQESTNSLLFDEGTSLHYKGKVVLRPPNIACASPKVVLCADSAKMGYIDEDETNDSLVLEFFPCSHIASEPYAVSQTNHSDLPAVLEANGEARHQCCVSKVFDLQEW